MNPFELRDNSTKVVLIVVGSVVGVLVLGLLACGGLTFYFVNRAGQVMVPQLQAQAEMAMADTAVQTFLNNLALGQVDVAYGSTTPAFQAKQTPQQFKKFVEGNPLLTKFVNRQQAPPKNAPGAQQMTLHYTLNGDGGAALTLTFQVVKDGEQWKIDSVSVP
jgi:hypothetical protein